MTRQALPERFPLPTRRQCITMSTEWQGHPMTVTVGLYPDGTPGEVFADHPKDAHRGAEWADVCTSLSIALQYGVPPAALARSLGTVPVWAIVDGQMQLVDASASPAGVIINCIIEAST